MAMKTSYTRKVADQICERMSRGETLRQICKTEGFPAAPTVVKWSEQDIDGFRERYAHARSSLLDHWAEEIVEISDDASGDEIETETGSRQNSEFAARSKLRVETRKWLLSKLRPDLYGDRQQVQHSGQVGFSLKIVLDPPADA